MSGHYDEAESTARACDAAIARAEKAEVELAALRIADARRTVALHGFMKFTNLRIAAVFADELGDDYSAEIVAAARKLLEQKDG